MRYKRIIWLMVLLVTVVMAWGQETVLTDNENGTWTLSCMPPYDVTLQVEYEDDGTPVVPIDLVDNENGTWTLSCMPPYDVTLQVEYEDAEPVAPIDLVDNGDGTWTLPCMPPYDVTLQVEYEDDPSEVYTEFVEETGTMTYYYDDKRESRTGVTELYDPVNNPDAVRFAGYNKKVTKVAIDSSMRRANLTSFRNMSYGGFDSETFTMYTLSNVTAIEGLENLNTEIVTDMNSMFQYPLVTSIDVSSFNTSNVTNMNGMFLGCNKLQTLDLTSFDVSKVKDMRMMFGSCYELTTIYCNDDWSQIVPPNNEMENMDNMYVMFSGCKKLVGGEGTPFDSNVINGTYARLDGGTASPGYFSKKPEYILGDANNSGGVEIGDITSVLTLMATPDATGYNNKAADANKSGNIEIGDITTILTIMAGGN